MVSIKSAEKKNTHYEILCGSALCAVMDIENKKVTFEEVKNLEFTPKEPLKN